MATESEKLIEVEDPRAQKVYYTRMTLFRRTATPLVLGIFKLLAQVKVEGKEKTPVNGALILATNHLTNFDVLPLQIALTRPIFFMGKEELFRNPLMDWAFRQLGGFPVHRGASDEWALRHAETILRRGQVLGIFPEGTRSRGKGLKPAKTGVARLAMTLNCPILPVALHGTQNVLKKFPRRAAVWVSISDPIYPRAQDTHASLTERVMFAIAERLPEELRGAYQYHPPGF